MALNCPTCKTPLERNGETAHCATCDKDFTVQALCPECHQALQVLKACGAVYYCLISCECIVLSFIFNI